MRSKALAPIVGLAIVLGGCGDTAPSAGDRPAGAASTQASAGTGRRWPEARLRRLTGLRLNHADLTYRLAAHPECATAALLRSTAEVRTYKAAGDLVVTNPDASAGVKASGLSPACRRLFAQALAKAR